METFFNALIAVVISIPTFMLLIISIMAYNKNDFEVSFPIWNDAEFFIIKKGYGMDCDFEIGIAYLK